MPCLIIFLSFPVFHGYLPVYEFGGPNCVIEEGFWEVAPVHPLICFSTFLSRTPLPRPSGSSLCFHFGSLLQTVPELFLLVFTVRIYPLKQGLLFATEVRHILIFYQTCCASTHYPSPFLVPFSEQIVLVRFMFPKS